MEEQQINPTHSFNLEDVEKYGSIEKALLIKEIRGMQVYKLRNGGQGWVYYSGEAFSKKFPYMSARSIRKWLQELVEEGHLENEIRNKTKYDQTKSYRLPNNDIRLAEMANRSAKMSNDIGRNGQPIPSPSSPTTSHKENLKKEKPNQFNDELQYLKEKTKLHNQTNQDQRGKPSPAKEKLRLQLREKQLLNRSPAIASP